MSNIFEIKIDKCLVKIQLIDSKPHDKDLFIFLKYHQRLRWKMFKVISVKLLQLISEEISWSMSYTQSLFDFGITLQFLNFCASYYRWYLKKLETMFNHAKPRKNVFNDVTQGIPKAINPDDILLNIISLLDSVLIMLWNFLEIYFTIFRSCT